jgi:Dyp-type peroxidase family
MSNRDIIEPVLEVHEIQGNIIPGFNKDHLVLIGYTVTNISKAKQWFDFISKHISTLYEVYNFNNVFKSIKNRKRSEPDEISSTWTNLAISYNGMRKLIDNLQEIDNFLDNSFKKGLSFMSSISLGDPNDLTSPGDSRNWVIGAKNKRSDHPNGLPDILLIVASDQVELLDKKVEFLKEKAEEYELINHYLEYGHDLSFYGDESRRGTEHFGFKDGVSQPGIRGRVSADFNKFLTDRKKDQQSNPNIPELSNKGRPLIAPGEFILGYPIQNENHPRDAELSRIIYPKFLLNGSYVVYRRLNQDVMAFERFIKREVEKIILNSNLINMTEEKFKAFLVGRWKSGAPLSLSPEQDNPDLGSNQFENNLFDYDDDPRGLKTPAFSHIRKINPRNLSEQGGSGLVLKKMILRRGIPFGDLVDPLNASSISKPRGLLFLSYQASISDKFEFIIREWANSKNRPHNPPSPNGNDSGNDFIIGQNVSNNRIRSGYIQYLTNGRSKEHEIKTQGLDILDWVTPTGGGYFFCPSISSIKLISTL